MDQPDEANDLRWHSWIRQQFNAFCSAVTFLTRVSLRFGNVNHQLYGQSLAYFPVVGLLVGLFAAAVYLISIMFWGHSIAVALTMISTIVLTGGFHEDGLADTADGLGGGWSQEDKLRIMKDSVLGTYGNLALVMCLLTKFAALSALPADLVPVTLVCAHVLGRWSTLPLLRYCPYLGGEQGTGMAFADSMTDQSVLGGTLVAGAVLLLFSPINTLILLGITLLMLILCRQFLLRNLGGITGDTLGACNQVLELTVYLVVASHFS